MPIYTHLELNHDITAPAGYYTPIKDARIVINDREVLYIVNQVVITSSCCGVANFTSAMVPGYIVRWHTGSNQDGLFVSEVEPIADEATRDLIRKNIREQDSIEQVDFW